MRKFMFGTLAVFMLLGGVVLLINVRAQAPRQAQIAFVSNRDGKQEIYVMDADGQNPRSLTKNPVWGSIDENPSWSPDGKRIAFRSYRDESYEIYVMDANGKNLRNLTNNPAWDGYPDWFDPAFAYSVSPAGKLRWLWGWLKQ